MIRVEFNRPTGRFKVWGPSGAQVFDLPAGGDAWGNWSTGSCVPGYGYESWCPPGYYALGPIDFFDPPNNSEGFGQIYVSDLSGATVAQLVAAGKATFADGKLTSNDLELPVGGLAAYDRSAIMVHCGGSNAPDPLADDQGLYRTYGCTRLLNADWRAFAAWLQPLLAGNVVLFAIVGDPLPLSD